MRMKAFCEATGLSRHTVNFYVRAGLLRPASGEAPGNNYRHFDAAEVEAARMIAGAKALGFSLAQIGALAARYRRTGASTAEKRAILREQLALLAERRGAIEAMETALRAKIERLA